MKQKKRTSRKSSQHNYSKKVVKKQYKIDLFKVFVFINFLLASALLIRDFVFWGIIPMFSGVFYQLTYFGLFIDLSAFFIIEVSIQCFKEWMK